MTFKLKISRDEIEIDEILSSRLVLQLQGGSTMFRLLGRLSRPLLGRLSLGQRNAPLLRSPGGLWHGNVMEMP